MKCELCGTEPLTIVLLPIHQENGSLITLACISCAVESGAYCATHERAHLGFVDGTHACALCIEQDVQKHAERAATIVEYVLAPLPPHERQRVKDAAATSSMVTGNCEKVSALRFVFAKARRLKCSWEELATLASETQSADYLLR